MTSVWIALAFSILVSIDLVGQVSFVEQNEGIFPTSAKAGVAVAIVDIDGDYRNDMVYLDEGDYLTVLAYRGSRQTYSMLYKDTEKTRGWSIVAGDVNGDGLTDIIVAGIFAMKLFTQTTDGGFESSTIYANSWLPQSSNLVDVDSDGDLDFYVSNDEGENLILLNDGFGNFSESDIIDFKTVPVSDNSGSYGSVWVDLNDDGNLDLFISKCRAGVTDPTDPTRINVYYVNNGDGTYTESAAEYGLADGLQSWSVDAGDVDNDGDQDLFITNHDGPHKLMINEGGTFVSYPYLDTPIENFSFQGVFGDIDNNGWLDIIMTDGSDNILLLNDEMNFTSMEWQSVGRKALTSIVGDINNDGFLDIWCQYVGDMINGSPDNHVPDNVLINQKNGNNFVTFSLGDSLRSNTIGAKAILSYGTQSQSRVVKIGNSYGQVGSNNLHFGLGGHEGLDSLTIVWMDGEEVSYDLSTLVVNNHYIIQRGSCISKIEPPVIENEGYICESETLLLSSEMGNVVMWNTGDDSQDLSVSEVGNYSYTYTDDSGCIHFSNYVNIRSDNDNYETILDLPDQIFACKGDTITLDAIDAEQYLWSTGEATQSIDVSQSGMYAVTVTSSCEVEFESKEILFELIIVEAPILEGDTLLGPGGKATLSSNSLSTRWYMDGNDESIGTGAEFVTDTLYETTVFLGAAIEEVYNKSGKLGLDTIPSTDNYSGNDLFVVINFEVKESILLHSVKVLTDTAGVRNIIIKNTLGETILSKSIDVQVGESVLILDADLSTGLYTISTDATINSQNFGHLGPRFARSQGNHISYPYTLDDAVSITGSNKGASSYYYFYDWDISYDFHSCESERVPVTVVVKPVSTTDYDLVPMSIYPNPNTGYFTVYLASGALQSMRLYDHRGSMIYTKELRGGQSDFTVDLELSSGIYLIDVITTVGDRVQKKLVVIE